MNPDALLKSLQAGTAKSLNVLASQLANGEIKASTFVNKGRDLLAQSHAQAFAIGRAKATDTKPGDATYADHLKADRIAKGQWAFLRGFAADIEAGRYDPKSQDGEGAKVRKARGVLYALKLGGTANEGFLSKQDADEEVLWVLHAKESCPDCIAEAGKGWRKRSDMDRLPGDGSTKCVTRCKCTLETREGATGFSNG